MELFIYETPYGNVADFRTYLDGRDHAFDDHRPLKASDPRWEKINSLRHPLNGLPIGGEIELVGKAETRWRELMLFPIVWSQEFSRLEAAGES